MKKRIAVFCLIISIIACFTTGIISYLSSSYIVDTQARNQAYTDINYIYESILTNNNASLDYNQIAIKQASILNNYSTATNTEKLKRITIISKDGTVLGDSIADYRTMENHLNRNEVYTAIQKQYDISQRLSHSLNTEYMYTAKYFPDKEIVIRIAAPLREKVTITNMVLTFTGIGILAGIILSVLTSSSLSSKVSKPINDLTKAANIIAYGDLSKRVETSAEGEVGLLVNTINYMAEKLENNFISLQNTNNKISKILDGIPDGVFALNKELKVIYCNIAAISMFQLSGSNESLYNKSFIELVRNPKINQMISNCIEKKQVLTDEVYFTNVTDCIYKVWISAVNTSNSVDKQDIEIIVVINDITKFKKLEKIRTEFVSNVSHELKTPLTSIRGFVETLKCGAINEPAIATSFLDIIEIESDRLTALINDILDLSEIESGKVDTNTYEFNFRDIILECIKILNDKSEQKNITIGINIDDNIQVKANPYRIKQICINLIDNAIKYNKDNGNITITAIKKGSILQFSIKDTGIGISESDQERIFERFYRVNKGRSRSMGGTGLGLSIVKHIVNLYQGDILVNSTPNLGTEFTILLPICL